MMAAHLRQSAHALQPVLIEGYASRFNHRDALGDIVRAGAFARVLREPGEIRMLLHHRPDKNVGRWLRLSEDGQGLHVRGLVEHAEAKTALRSGLNGLSIGFRPRLWQALSDGGRKLADIELIEISLVRVPMLIIALLRFL